MTAVHLAKPDDLARLGPLVDAFHQEMGVVLAPAERDVAIEPLLQGSPHGVVYLIGPQRAPIGYVIISFGWSLAYGGMDGRVDEIFIRAGVRGRGIGSEVIAGLSKALGQAGLKALHLDIGRDDSKAQAFYEKLRFQRRDTHMCMTMKL